MRVSGRNRRQSYRGEEATMAFWLPLNASVFFAFFSNSIFHPRPSVQFNRPLCNALSIAFFIPAHCPPFFHPSSPRFFSWITSFETSIPPFISFSGFFCGRLWEKGADEVCRRVFKSYELDNFCNEIFVQDQWIESLRLFTLFLECKETFIRGRKTTTHCVRDISFFRFEGINRGIKTIGKEGRGNSYKRCKI